MAFFIKRALLSLLMLMAAGTAAWAEGETAYAVWCADNTTLYFFGSDATLAAGDTFTPEGATDPVAITNVWSGTAVTATGTNKPGWYNTVKGSLTTVVFEPSFADVAPTSLRYWFQDCTKLTTVTGLGYLNTSAATTMYSMFEDCSLLSAIDVSSFNTSAVTDMQYMFYNCKALTTLDLSNFNTANVTTMYQMFYGCSALQSLNLSGWDTASLTSTSQMFRGCTNLETLNLSGWVNTKLTNLSQMFYDCKKLSTLTLTGFQTPAATSFNSMFANCQALESIDLSGLNTEKVTDMQYMFYGCTALENLDLSSFNTAALTSTYQMFYNCTALQSLNLSGWDTASLTSTSQMFRGCTNLETLNLSGWVNTKLTNLSQMFYDCKKLSSLTLTGFQTSAATNMNYMFYNCQALTSLDLTGFSTANVTDVNNMFNGCTNLQSLNLSGWTNTKLTNMSQMFYNCAVLNTLNLTDFVTPAATTMSNTFYGCKALIALDLSNWNTTAVTSTNNMFYGCTALQTLNLSNWNTAKVTNMSQMFYNCGSLESIYVSLSWTAGNATSSGNMFYGCNSLVGQDGTTLASYSPQSLDRTHATDEAGGYMKTGTQAPDYDEPMPYAIWCADNQTLYFLQSTKQLVSGRSFTPAGSTTPMRMTTVWNGTQVTATGSSNPQWYSTVKASLQHVIFEPSFADVTPASLCAWFRDCANLTDLTGIGNLNMTNVTRTDYMFQNCSSLQSIDVTSFNTDNVTTFQYMFSGCSALTSINVTGFNTEKVTTFQYMFSGCSALTSINVTGWNTAKVGDMRYMFQNCSSLSAIDVSSFTMENISYLDYMFAGCTGLTTLQLSSFNIGSRNPSLSNMFNGCSQLQSIYVSDRWPLAKRTDANVFAGCTALVGEDGSTIGDGSAVTAARAHYGVGGLLRKGTQTPNATPTNYALYCADNQTIYFTYTTQYLLQGGVFIPEGETIGHAIYSLKSNNSGNATSNPSWDNTVKQNATTAVFESSYAQLVPTSLNGTFNGCSALTTINGLGNLNTENVTDMRNVFYGCTALQSLDLSSFVTVKTTNMSSMFYNCSQLQSISVGDGWTTSAVGSSSNMFYNCTSLPNFNASVVDKTNAHPYEGGYLTEGTSTPIAPTVYALWCADNATLYFLKSTKRLVTGRRFTPDGSTTAVNITNLWTEEKITATGSSQPIWTSTTAIRNAIQHVAFEASFADVVPASVFRWFNSCTALTDITGLEYLNTSETTSMYSMFDNCKLLNSLDLSHFNTAKVTDMRYMFYNCTALETLDLSSFTTPEVTVMDYMFYGCSSLKSLDLHGFSNEKVESLGDMFDGCKALQTLNMNGFGIGQVTNLQNMFEGCSALTSLDLHTFNTANVTQMGYMFQECSSLQSVNLSGWNTEKVTSIGGMFYNCKALQSIDLSSFRGTSLTSIGSMFKGCESLESIDLSSLGQTNVTSISGMFNGCKNVRTINLSGFSTGNISSMGGLFQGMEKLESVDLSGFNMSSVTNMESMFDGCKKLQTIEPFCNPEYVDGQYAGFTTGEVTSVTAMFRDCESLESLDLSFLVISEELRNYNYMFKNCRSLRSVNISTLTGGVPWYLKEMFSGCAALESIDLSSIYFSFVQQMDGMFAGCASLKSVDLSTVRGNGYNVMNMTGLFEGCTSLESVNMKMKSLCEKAWRAVWNDNSTDYVQMTNLFKDCSSLTTFSTDGLQSATAGSVDLTGVFSGCSSLTSLDLSKGFWVSKATNFSSLFAGCSSLRELDLSSFNPNNVTNMSGMFQNCTNLESIYIDDSWTTAAVTESTDMFAGCTSLVGQDGSRLGTLPAVDATRAHYEAGGLMHVVAMPYAIYCEENQTLYLTYGSELYAAGGQYTPEGATEPLTITSVLKQDQVGDNMITNAEAVSATRVVIEQSFAQKQRPSNLSNWFKGGANLTQIVGLESLNTSEVEWMSNMFEGCSKLTTLDLSSFDMSHVCSVSSMFKGCTRLESVNLDFAEPCTLTWIYGLESVFENCMSLVSVDLSKFNTAEVESMANMFYCCSNLQSITFGDNWNTENVEDMSYMFAGCTRLQSIDLSHFSNKSCTDMTYMFGLCASLKELDMSTFTGDGQKDYARVYRMFYYCADLEAIYTCDRWVGHYSDTEDNNGYKGYMFYGCTKIVGEDGTTYDPDYTGSERAKAIGGYFRYKGIEVTVPASGVGTFSAACKTLVPEGVTAYIAPDYEGDESLLIIDQLTKTVKTYNDIPYEEYTVVPANTGILFFGTPGETVKFVITHKSDDDVVSAPTYEHNMLVALTEPLHLETTYGDNTNFALDGDKFSRVGDSGIDMPANTAVLQIPTSVVQDAVTVWLVAQHDLSGDANGDGAVTIADVTAVIGYLLGNPPAQFNKQNANVDGDLDGTGEPNITMTDVMGIISIILNNRPPSPSSSLTGTSS